MHQPNYQSDFAPMPIAALLDGNHHFVIPSFQRGYRWEEKQVTDLLDDIRQFADDSAAGSAYYLQPIVVKATTYQGRDAWEVLDGQQRLTTMLLILKRLMKRLGEEERECFEGQFYDIVYLSRPQLNFDNPDPKDNLDSYYLAKAKDVIDDWFKQKFRQNLDNFKATLLYNQQRQVKIIWYAINPESRDLVSINIFNRLNKGKIALTAAELIKALFIMDYDLRAAEGDKLPAEQLSMQWNEMERRFQDNRFWYFISDDKRGTQTRIDVLFDFVTRRPDDADTDYSYRQFQHLFDFCRERRRSGSEATFEADWATGIQSMEDAWRHVRRTFDRLVAWYEDNLYYHYVGYLVAVGFTPLQVFNSLEDAKAQRRVDEPDHEWTIDDTRQALRRKMMERFRSDNKFLQKDDIDDLEYRQEYVARLLLLFNVESCRRGNNIRFDFHRFKTGSWDVEHVDSQNEATLQEFADRMRWLKQVKFILEKENTEAARSHAEECQRLIDDFTTRSRVDRDKYLEFYTRINRFYAREADENEDEVNLTAKKKDFISNLTLLDSATNREYKDAPFAYKRYLILEYDREGTRFIPLCTRNLFLKYFTNSDACASHLDAMRWSMADRRCYLRAIHEAVDDIFDSVITKKEEARQ
jgi:hypothetical protein